MASIKDLKKRIGTVKNTQQTTRAMKLVSAAKLRRSQDAIHNQRPYARRIGGLIELVSALAGKNGEKPLIKREIEENPEARKKLLLVLVTSDRGLCGAFNSNVIRMAQRVMKDISSAEYESVKLSFVGRRGYDFFKNRQVALGPYFEEAGGKAAYSKAKGLADKLLAMYVSGEVDEVRFIYNEFKNAVSQTVLVEQYIPLQPTAKEDVAGEDQLPMYIVKPSKDEILQQLLAKTFADQAFRILLDSQASEHGARMSAMENATKNAGEMMKKLTLEYNRQRQAGITKELLEIISGAESQKNA